METKIFLLHLSFDDVSIYVYTHTHICICIFIAFQSIVYHNICKSLKHSSSARLYKVYLYAGVPGSLKNENIAVTCR